MEPAKRIIVAIDGPAGAGKSTIARAVARRLGIVYVDTGAMYRAIGLWALRQGCALDNHQALEQLAAAAAMEFTPSGGLLLNGEDVTAAIREPGVSDAASRVSAVPGVRRTLVAKQRELARHASVVMEGRDIGSVVFPEANIKIYLDATPGVRAQRRATDESERGRAADVAAIEAEIAERDRRDSTRPDSPLRQAPDAVYLDTSGMDAPQAEESILRIIRERVSNGKDIHR
ncbi:MAG: (d)CMP kinase [Acidobacteria bacterium]|nr:(d)CMP kinase [Acidobacteriota bacterium]